MNHLAVALVTVAVLAADFGSAWLGLPAKQQQGWATASTLALLYCAFYFWKAFEKKGEEKEEPTRLESVIFRRMAKRAEEKN